VASYTVPLPGGGQVRAEVTRAEFEAAAAPLVQRTLKLLRQGPRGAPGGAAGRPRARLGRAGHGPHYPAIRVGLSDRSAEGVVPVARELHEVARADTDSGHGVAAVGGLVRARSGGGATDPRALWSPAGVVAGARAASPLRTLTLRRGGNSQGSARGRAAPSARRRRYRTTTAAGRIRASTSRPTANAIIGVARHAVGSRRRRRDRTARRFGQPRSASAR